MIELGSREEEVDIFCLQEMAVSKEDGLYRLEGYESICGIGRYVEKKESLVVGMMISKMWRGKYEIIHRSEVKRGISLKVGGGRRISVWNVYVGVRRQESYEFPDGDGNVVVLGTFNAWRRRWGGLEEIKTKERRIVEEWVDSWGWKVVNEVGEITREDNREGFRGRVLDLAISGDEVIAESRVVEGLVALDYRSLEVEVSLEGWR